MSRRDVLKGVGAAAVTPRLGSLIESMADDKAVRCINVVNFMRGVEPRFETDLLLPVQKQMEIIKARQLPATWLFQYDALVDPKFVDYLKANMPKDHEVGVWFEMNQKHCDAAGVAWRGRPGYEWDHLPPVAFTIGYTPEERVKLADALFGKFKEIWGKYPKSVASWNLDSLTMKHLCDKYGVDAFAVCRDQIATDGFTIWGAPIAGYYPSDVNCWSPACDPKHQINTPVFRMLGQDPVHYYSRSYKLPDGRTISEPDTMEPVWTSGRSPGFVKTFLKMIADDPTGRFAYAQLGQENSFSWKDQEAAYPMQMKALAELRATGKVFVETMGDSGRRFKKAFKVTPVQAQVMLDDPFGAMDPPERTIWYQSRFYRANLHVRGDRVYFRDITVYSDKFKQPYLREATRLNDVEQRMPAILDGYHWSKERGDGSARGDISVDGRAVRLTGKPVVTASPNSLTVNLPVDRGGTVTVRFTETDIEITCPEKGAELALDVHFDVGKAGYVTCDSPTYRQGSQTIRVHTVHGLTETRSGSWSTRSLVGKLTWRLKQD